MVTFKSSDVTSSPESDSAKVAVLDANIETLTAFRDMVEATPLKAIFESVILILTIVRVRLGFLFLFLHRLIGGTTRTR